ncbi:MAG: thiamine pyrophosphate-dependent enzyme [Dehalococcoidales bacterium]|jgi:phosphonopyruvate decarboxylase|nr:thiamine pyrophosphate-dependent enzyme [Dehalococcoidales bacterium]|tara:strand:- start:4 stop:585 length:582 start_codon:yes stop_codon:yes gene_type:complete
MKRAECLKVLAEYRTDELVLTAWQTSYAWEQISPSPYNFPSVRTMGECSTFGLGLSLARPDRRVVVLEGDGSLCMNLGSLLTIARAAPPNFYQFIMHNGVYETTGGQTIPNIDHLDLVMIARGAGIPHLHRYSDLAGFERGLPDLFRERGPVFTVLDIEPDETHLSGKEFGRKVRSRDTFYNKQFREALATSA